LIALLTHDAGEQFILEDIAGHLVAVASRVQRNSGKWQRFVRLEEFLDRCVFCCHFDHRSWGHDG
jgi:hypothetical protein